MKIKFATLGICMVFVRGCCNRLRTAEYLVSHYTGHAFSDHNYNNTKYHRRNDNESAAGYVNNHNFKDSSIVYTNNYYSYPNLFPWHISLSTINYRVTLPPTIA